jgi:hypothetical protein
MKVFHSINQRERSLQIVREEARETILSGRAGRNLPRLLRNRT